MVEKMRIMLDDTERAAAVSEARGDRRFPKFFRKQKRLTEDDMSLANFSVDDQREQDDDVINAALVTKKMYDAYVQVGFTPDQAMELVHTSLHSAISRG